MFCPKWTRWRYLVYMLIAIVPLVVLILGALVFGLASNPKVSEMGRIAFFCGLFATVWVMSGRTVRLL